MRLRLTSILLASMLVTLMRLCHIAAAEPIPFQKAVPVWPAEFAQTMNAHIGFRAVVEIPGEASTTATLRIAAAGVYRVYSMASSPAMDLRVPQPGMHASTSGPLNCIPAKI